MKFESHMAGQMFGRLRVIEPADKKGHMRCQCTCKDGTQVVRTASDLRNGRARSCGCVRRGRPPKHGKAGTKTWSAWRDAKSRCFNPKHQHFAQYGGRGITMCDEWTNDFRSFLEHMGECGEGRSLDRIDGNKGYFPGNCYWATHKQQMANRRTRRSRFDLVGEGWSLTIRGPVSERVVLSQTGKCRSCGRPTYLDDVTCGQKECEALSAVRGNGLEKKEN